MDDDDVNDHGDVVGDGNSSSSSSRGMISSNSKDDDDDDEEEASELPLLHQHQPRSHRSQPLQPQQPQQQQLDVPLQVSIPPPVDDALLEQWKIVYKNIDERNNNNNMDDDNDNDDDEHDRERGGLVLYDGNVNPGHFCFDSAEEQQQQQRKRQLSPLSKIIVGPPATGGNNDDRNNNLNQYDGRVRVGTCDGVYSGWDHTNVIGLDPSTYHYAATVFAHFHIHADNAFEEIWNIRRQSDRRSSSSGASSTTKAYTSSSYTSTPSCGDICAWLTYHRNVPRAMVVTRTTTWLFVKFAWDGHTKHGIECPAHIIQPWISYLTNHEYDPIAIATTEEVEIGAAGVTETDEERRTTTSQSRGGGMDNDSNNTTTTTTTTKTTYTDFANLYHDMLQHGFVIYTRPLLSSSLSSSLSSLELATADNDVKMSINTNPNEETEEEDVDDCPLHYTLWIPPPLSSSSIPSSS